MKINIVYLLLIALLGIIVSASVAQQNQNVPKTDTEVEKLKIQLQTVENEKMEKETKLAEANAKLINTDIDKLKGELRESNNDWLRAWSGWFLTIIGIFAAILLGVSYVFWFWLKSKTDKLIANEVEKSLNGFKEAVEQVKIQQDRIRILEKEIAASVLEDSIYNDPKENLEEILYSGSEQIKALSEQAILDIFSDETRYLALRCRAAEVLANRKSIKLVSPLLGFLNSSVDSGLYDQADPLAEMNLRRIVYCLAYIHTPETYEGLTEFLNRLITANPKHKDLFLTVSVFSLAWVSVELNRRDSLSILKRAIPFVKVFTYEDQALKNLAEHFDKLNEPEGIKEILTNGLTDNMPDVETRCLELLEKYDAEFVKEWKEKKETTNTESEES